MLTCCRPSSILPRCDPRHGRATVGFFQEYPLSDHEKLFDEDEIVPLIAASRILDTAAQPQLGLKPNERTNLGLLAAAAFSNYGNFPSAVAIFRKIIPDLTEISSSLAVAVAICAPDFLSVVIAQCPSGSRERGFLEAIEYFLASGDISLIEMLRTDFVECLLHTANPFEGALLRSVRLRKSFPQGVVNHDADSKRQSQNQKTLIRWSVFPCFTKPDARLPTMLSGHQKHHTPLSSDILSSYGAGL
jgi:hypothetical protein